MLHHALLEKTFGTRKIEGCLLEPNYSANLKQIIAKELDNSEKQKLNNISFYIFISPCWCLRMAIRT